MAEGDCRHLPAALVLIVLTLSAMSATAAPLTSADNGYDTDEHHKFAVTFDIPGVSNCDHYLIDFGDGSSIDSLTDDTSSVNSVYDPATETWTYRVMHVYPEVPGTYTMEFTAYNGDGEEATNGLNVRLLGYPVISFETNGGNAIDPIMVPNGPDNGGTAYSCYYVPANAPSDPVKDGNVFSGWYSDSDLQYEWDWDYPVTGDMTLYAAWAESAEEYTITFYVDRVPYDVRTFSAGERITLPSQPSKDGYRFIGWKGYSDGMTATETRGFCAMFESVNDVSYSVSYVVNGSVYSRYVIAGSVIDFEPPVREGYVFEGWYADPSYSVSLTDAPVNSDMQIYPKFTEEDKGGPDMYLATASALLALIGIGMAAAGFKTRSAIIMIAGCVLAAAGIAVIGLDFSGVIG